MALYRKMTRCCGIIGGAGYREAFGIFKVKPWGFGEMRGVMMQMRQVQELLQELLKEKVLPAAKDPLL